MLRNIYILICLFILVASCKKDTYTADPYSLWEVRYQYKGADAQLPPSLIWGVVTNDNSNGNTPSNYVTVQFADRAIVLLVDDAKSFQLGDSIKVNVTGHTITRDNGTLAIKDVKADSIQVLAKNKGAKANTNTLSVLKNNGTDFDCSLVTIKGNVKVKPGDNAAYGGDHYLVSGSDTIILHTEPNASFANNLLPASGTFTGNFYLRTNGAGQLAPQLWIRKLSDVK